MSQSQFIFAGGGTGGHLFPGLAVAAAVRRIAPDSAIAFYTTNRPLDRELLGKTDYQQIEQGVRPMTLRPWRWPAFLSAWRASVAAATRNFRARRPAAVLGLGGYAAGPAVVAARGMGIRTAILNPDAIPGRANRFLARRVDLVVQQWDVSARYLSPSANCVTLGCPIRGDFAQAATQPASAIEEGRQRFGLAANRRVLLVTGASQGARTINEAVRHVWPEFARNHPEWQLLHLAGTADEAVTRSAYEAAGLPRDSVRVVGFSHEMWLAMAAADAVVSRAGASTLAELTALGKPSILLPYPFHRDRHQHANAHVLADAGAAILVEDLKQPARTGGALLAALEEVARAATREQMSRAARKLGRPSAADAVAVWMMSGELN